MEVLKLDIVGSYSYKPDIEIISYKDNHTHNKECVICKRLLFEPSYEMISDNKNILNDNEIVIGKCGHMYHSDCLNMWLKTCDTCPIDKVKWHVHRIADTTTSLVVFEPNKNSKFIKNKFCKNIKYNNMR